MRKFRKKFVIVKAEKKTPKIRPTPISDMIATSTRARGYAHTQTHTPTRAHKHRPAIPTKTPKTRQRIAQLLITCAIVGSVESLLSTMTLSVGWVFWYVHDSACAFAAHLPVFG